MAKPHHNHQVSWSPRVLGLVPLGLAFHCTRGVFFRAFIFSILGRGWCPLISVTIIPRRRDALRHGYQKEGRRRFGCTRAFQQSPRRATGRGRAASPSGNCTCRDVPVRVGASQPLVFAHACVCARVYADVQLTRRETRFSPRYTVLGGCVSTCVGGHRVFLLLPTVYQSKAGLVYLVGKKSTQLE